MVRRRRKQPQQPLQKGKKKPQSSSSTAPPAGAQVPSVWMPATGGALQEDEELQYDPTAYDCMASLTLEWPSLSFDIMRDGLGDNRKEFPHCLSFVAGTQAGSAKLNHLAVVRVTNLHKSKAAKKNENNQEEEEDDDDVVMMSEDEDEEDETVEAVLHVRKIAHPMGGINRVRAMPQNGCIIASWSDTAQVQTWDVSSLYEELVQEGTDDAGQNTSNNAKSRMNSLRALQVHGHAMEGYALDWSPCVAGRLASGDCRAGIHVWEPVNGGKWTVGGAIKGHTASVEDIQWSPGEPTVFASASVDKTVKIWDTRDTSRGAMITFMAHDTDVNVISWNRQTMYMLASGGDDGTMRVWDLRTMSQSQQEMPSPPVANFSHHKGPVTSIEWCPYEASMLTTTSSDDTLAVWDLALERDPEEEAALAPDTNVATPEDLPPQLLFVHAGQKDMKEAHWHGQIPGMILSTASDGFNIFKPYNV